MKNIKLLFLLILLIPCLTFAQSAKFLIISPSPTMNGMGEIGVCLPSKDPMSGYYNPANGLELFEGVSFSYSKMKTPWLTNLGIDDMSLEYEVENIGIIPKIIPVKIVLSHHRTFLDLGEQYRTDEFGNDLGTFNSNMSANAFITGVGYKGRIYKVPINISMGITIKNAEQLLGAGEINNIFFDYGLLFSIPYKQENIFNSLELMVMPTFGYSVSNIGGDIKYNNSDYKRASPRFLRSGISATVILSYKNKINFFKWQGGLAASDELVEPRYNYDDEIKYQSGFGDINFYKNVILNKKSDLVTVHKGFEVTLLDIYTYRIGKLVDVSGDRHLDTKGFGLESDGLFKLLTVMAGSPIFVNISKYINVQYNYSEYRTNEEFPLYDTKFHSFSFTINNIDDLFTEIFLTK